MSIINDALKKAGKETSIETASKTSSSKNEFRPEFLNKKNSANWGPLFILLVLLLITGPIIAPAFSTPFKNAGTSPSQGLAPKPAQASVPQNVKAQFAIEEAPTMGFVAAPRPNLSLNGIVFSASDHNNSYCLINGRIIKVGEGIDGAKLTKVTPEEVTLDYRGETIILPVSA